MTMSVADLAARAYGRYQRTAARLLFRRPLVLENSRPIISFTFDDFPRSALHTGGAILRGADFAGTYYASLGLMGTETPTGRMFVAEDLDAALEQGHELGCHTFAHCNSWETDASAFESSVMENRRTLSALAPQTCFRTLSFPITPPRPLTKRRVASQFACARGSGQTFNAGTIDLNNLYAYFIEQARGRLDRIEAVVEENTRRRGWLIFATHDVCDMPTPFGCTTTFFEHVVRLAVTSGAKILPVVAALEEVRSSQSNA